MVCRVSDGWFATSLHLLGAAIALVESTQTTSQVRVQVVEVDGEYEAFSGSRNRLLVWEVYGPLVLKGGPLGFGTEAVSSFPPNILVCQHPQRHVLLWVLLTIPTY